MIGYVEAPKAWWLTYGMARVVGVNLPHAVLDGFVKRSELAAMVSRCQSCGKADACSAWLAQVVTEPQLPVLCRNKAELEALSPRS